MGSRKVVVRIANRNHKAVGKCLLLLRLIKQIKADAAKLKEALASRKKFLTRL